jgi:hypothetical protein
VWAIASRTVRYFDVISGAEVSHSGRPLPNPPSAFDDGADLDVGGASGAARCLQSAFGIPRHLYLPAPRSHAVFPFRTLSASRSGTSATIEIVLR